jgi:hypothetical protein
MGKNKMNKAAAIGWSRGCTTALKNGVNIDCHQPPFG